MNAHQFLELLGNLHGYVHPNATERSATQCQQQPQALISWLVVWNVVARCYFLCRPVLPAVATRGTLLADEVGGLPPLCSAPARVAAVDADGDERVAMLGSLGVVDAEYAEEVVEAGILAFDGGVVRGPGELNCDVPVCLGGAPGPPGSDLRGAEPALPVPAPIGADDNVTDGRGCAEVPELRDTCPSVPPDPGLTGVLLPDPIPGRTGPARPASTTRRWTAVRASLAPAPVRFFSVSCEISALILLRRNATVGHNAHEAPHPYRGCLWHARALSRA